MDIYMRLLAAAEAQHTELCSANAFNMFRYIYVYIYIHICLQTERQQQVHITMRCAAQTRLIYLISYMYVFITHIYIHRGAAAETQHAAEE